MSATSPSQSSSLTFADLSLDPQVLSAVESLGYKNPTEVQALTIPQLLEGNDILGVSQTGTGKTAAFALPLLSTLESDSRHIQVLCLTPTRELAIQVATAFNQYAQHMNAVSAMAIYGGSSYSTQIKQLAKGIQIVVGTPGRVIDLIEKGKLKLEEVRSIILDEADEMLKMGFVDEVEWILSHTPKDKQSVLFSATMPKAIRNISQKYLKNPYEITIKNQENSTKNIAQSYLYVANKEKLKALQYYLEIEATDGVIIFCRTKKGTADVANFLELHNYKVDALNGDVTQENREKIVRKLKSGTIDVVTATDVAARGIDVKRLTHVINFDMADDVSTYVHRIGRVGRAGRSGSTIVFLGSRNQRIVKEIEFASKNDIKEYKFPSVKEINNLKVQKLFTTIQNTSTTYLNDYASLIEQYQKEHYEDPETLLAKLLCLAHDQKPFFSSHEISFSQSVKEGNEGKRRNRGDRPRRGGGPGGRGEGSRSGEGGRRNTRPERGASGKQQRPKRDSAKGKFSGRPPKKSGGAKKRG